MGNYSANKQTSIMTDPGETASRGQVAFVIDSVDDHQALVAAIKAGTTVVVLDGSADALAQMTQWLGDRDPASFDAIHLVGHGASGAIDMGSWSLTADSLAEHAQALGQLGAALTPDGDLLVYGCDVGQGADAEQFIADLAAATGADVAASDNASGATALGGDWILEVEQGDIRTEALWSLGPDTYLGLLATPTVTKVTQSSGNSAYKAGATVTFTVTFSEAVKVTTTGGTPTIQLETGYSYFSCRLVRFPLKT